VCGESFVGWGCESCNVDLSSIVSEFTHIMGHWTEPLIFSWRAWRLQIYGQYTDLLYVSCLSRPGLSLIYLENKEISVNLSAWHVDRSKDRLNVHLDVSLR
jgi:hypothetical protein